jgi:prepilin-type N-terminal cleavage/methylation domain-containing protein
MLKLSNRRPGFTLIEMLVVLSLVLLLATILVTLGPRLAERARAAKGAELLQEWLLVAKQRALRDKIPTGIRLIPGTGGLINTVQYIQQPNDLTLPGSVTVTMASATVTPQHYDYVDLLPGSTPNFIGDFTGIANQPFWNVQPGDYIQLADSAVHLIGGTNSAGAPIATPVFYNTGTSPPDSYRLQINWAGAPTTMLTVPDRGYKIIRSPRPIHGEEPLILPQDIAIDTSANANFGDPLPADPYTGNIDIVFSPGGPVIGRGTSTGKITLWVKDTTQPATADNQKLIVVYTRTGFIGAHPVNLAANTTLAAAAAPGSTTITVTNPAGIDPGSYLVIVDPVSPPTQELVQVSTSWTPGSTNVLLNGTVMNPAGHPAGATVVSDPYTYTRDGRSSGL